MAGVNMASYLDRAQAAREQRRRDRLNVPDTQEFDMEEAVSQVTMASVPKDNVNAPVNAPGGANNDLLASIETLLKNQTETIMQRVEQIIKNSGGLAP